MILRIIVVALVVVGALAAWQAWRLDRQGDALAQALRAQGAMQAQIEQQAQSLAVHRAHVDRMQREAAQNAETIRFLQSLEGADAPLSAAATAGARRLWGR